MCRYYSNEVERFRIYLNNIRQYQPLDMLLSNSLPY